MLAIVIDSMKPPALTGSICIMSTQWFVMSSLKAYFVQSLSPEATGMRVLFEIVFSAL